MSSFGGREAWCQAHVFVESGCFLKQIWFTLICSSSLWVVWVETYVLRDLSLWLVHADASMSWCFRAILRCRDSLLPHVRLEVGDG